MKDIVEPDRSVSAGSGCKGSKAAPRGMHHRPEHRELRRDQRSMYDDDYATCVRTHATLRVYTGDMDPSSVTDRLRVEPTRSVRRGETTQQPGWPPIRAMVNGWFLDSEGHVH